MTGLVVNVNIGSLYVRQAFELRLESLGLIVTPLHRLMAVHDDIDLNDDPRPTVVCADGVNSLDVRGVGHGWYGSESGTRVAAALTDVGDPLLDLGIGRNANEKLELAIRRVQPECGDEHGEDDGAHRVDPPGQLAPTDGREDTKAVDEQIVAVVLPKDPDLGVLIPQRPTVEEEAQLRDESNGHGNDGRQPEALSFVHGLRVELHRRHDDENEGHGSHEEAEHDVAGRLDARLARGEAARVDARDGAVGDDERDVGQRVEDGVRHGRPERQRAGRDGRVELQRRQHDVGGERALHRDLDAQLVRAQRLARVAHVLVDGLEEALDVGVLALVELLQPARLRRPPVERERPAAVALARRVGPDRAELRRRLEARGELVGVVVPRRPAFDVAGAVRMTGHGPEMGFRSVEG